MRWKLAMRGVRSAKIRVTGKASIIGDRCLRSIFIAILLLGISANVGPAWTVDGLDVPAQQLDLLQQIVDATTAAVEGIRSESLVGSRTTQEILDGEERLYSATDALSVAKLIAKSGSGSRTLAAQIGEIKLAGLRKLRQILELQLAATQERQRIGELTKTDVSQVLAALLNAKYRESQAQNNLRKLQLVKKRL